MPTARILIERIVIGAALALALVYAGDYLSVRFRMLHAKPADPFESVTAPRLLAIPEKGNKTTYELDEQNPTQTVVCVHSLFPHMGNPPCWYLKKKLTQPIPMTLLAPATLYFDKKL
jgi:hypothetical protein